MPRTPTAAFTTDAALKNARPFVSAVFHFGGSVGDVYIDTQARTIGGNVHKAALRRLGDWRYIVEPHDGRFSVSSLDIDLINFPLFGAPLKRFTDLWSGAAVEGVEVDVYQNLRQVGTSTILQELLFSGVVRPESYGPNFCRLRAVSISEKYLDRAEVSFPLSQADFPLIKLSEIGQTAHQIYGDARAVRAHQVKAFPTSPLVSDMNDSQTTMPLYQEFIDLLSDNGVAQIGSEQVSWGQVGAPVPISAQHLTTSGDINNAGSYITATIAPGANRLVLAWIMSRRNVTGGPLAPTLSGCGLTWVQVTTVLFANDDRRLTLLRALGPSPTSGAVTISFSDPGNQSACYWSIAQFDGVDISGANGSGALVQSAHATASDVTSLSVNLGAFSSANNATAGAFSFQRQTPPTITPGGGFTELAEFLDSTEGAAIQSEWRADNDQTVDASTASSNPFWAAIAVEIKAATNQSNLNNVTRGANGTAPTSHAAGDTVIFFPSELIYQAAGHAIKSLSAVYVKQGDRKIPVKPSRYTTNLANTTLVSGKTLSTIRMTAPPLKEERLYKETVAGVTASIASGQSSGTAESVDFGSQDKTKSSGDFRYTVPWALTTGSEASLRVKINRNSEADIVLYETNSAGAVIVNVGTPFIFHDAHFHSGAAGSDRFLIQVIKVTGTAAAAQTVETGEIVAEYLVASALDDPLADLDADSEITQTQEGNGGSFSMASGGASATLSITMGAQLKAKSSGKFRYRFTWSYSGDEANVRIEIVRHSTNGTEGRIVLYETDPSSKMLTRENGTFEWEDDHWHNAADARRLQIKVSKKTGTASVISVVTVGLVTVEYQAVNPAAATQTDPLLAATAADLIVGGDVYFDCEGYQDDASGTYTGTPNALIEKPPDVAHHLARHVRGIPVGRIDAASFQQAREDLPSTYKFAGPLTDRSSTLKLLFVALGVQGRMIVEWPADKLTCRALKTTHGASIKTITQEMVMRETLKVEHTPAGDLLNVVDLYFGRDFSRPRGPSAFKLTRKEDSASIGKYQRRDQAERFLFDFVPAAAKAMADDLRDFWLARLANPARIVTLDGKLDLYELLPGDIVALDYAAPAGGQSKFDNFDGTQKLLVEAASLRPGSSRDRIGTRVLLTLREVIDAVTPADPTPPGNQLIVGARRQRDVTRSWLRRLNSGGAM